MARFAAGDEGGLEELMRRYGKKLFGGLVRIVKDRADAAELVQEAFIRVARHRMNYRYEARFSAWLYTIGLNLARSLLRSRARQPEIVSLDEVDPNGENALNEALADAAPAPSRQAENDEWTEALEGSLQALPTRLREPLLLVALDSCPQAKVAQHLNCSVKAVETRIYHARRRLRAELERSLNPWPIRTRRELMGTRPHTSEGYHSGRRMK